MRWECLELDEEQKDGQEIRHLHPAVCEGVRAVGRERASSSTRHLTGACVCVCVCVCVYARARTHTLPLGPPGSASAFLSLVFVTPH